MIQKLLALFFKASPVIVALAFFSILFLSIYENTFSPMFFALLLGIAGMLICKIVFKKNSRKAMRLFVLVFSFNVLMSIVIYGDVIREKGMPYLGSDDVNYEQYAYDAIDSGSVGYVGSLLYFRTQGHSDGSFYYAAFLAAIHGATQSLNMSSHTLNPRFVNSFFLAFIGIVAWRFGVLLGFSNATAKLSGYLSGFWPLLVFHSAMIRRDTIFAFFLLLSVYLYASFLQNKSNIRLSKVLVFICSVIIVSLLRYGFWAIYLFLFCGILALWYKGTLNKRNYMLKTCSMLLLMFVVFIGLSKSNLFHRNVNMSVAEMGDQYSSYAKRRASYSEKGIGSSLFRLPALVGFPARLAYASVTPPPIPTTFLTYNIRWIGTIPWFLCLPILMRTIFYAMRSRGREFIALKALAASFITYYMVINLISFTETQQMMYIPYGVLLIMYGLENQTRSLHSSISGMILVGILLTAVYVGMKLVL
jgi:hypothetical protein